MAEETIITLRKDGREQVLVGPRAEAVAAGWEKQGWKRYTPPEPYDADTAVRKEARKASRREAQGQKRATAPKTARSASRGAKRGESPAKAQTPATGAETTATGDTGAEAPA